MHGNIRGQHIELLFERVLDMIELDRQTARSARVSRSTYSNKFAFSARGFATTRIETFRSS